MKKKLLMLLTSMLPIFFIFTSVQAEDTIDIVFDNSYAPFEFKDSDQVYKGLDVDIINEVAKRSGWNMKQSFPGFDAAVNAVQSGSADALMAGTTITEARKKVFTFSDPYFDTKIIIATTKSNTITSYNDLNGKTVGVKNGTAAQVFLDENKEKYGYSVKTFDTGDLMYNSLSAGAVDAVMDDEAVIQYAIQQGQDLSIDIAGEAIGSFGFSVKKGSQYEYLVTDFNKALAEMKKDGTYQNIMNKWFGSAASTEKTDYASRLTLTGNAIAKATAIKTNYTIVSDSSFAPFEYQDETGKYVGIDMELIKAIAEQQGFTITIQNPGFDAALNAVQAGQADAVIAGMSITDARKEIFDFSNAYYSSNILLAVKNGSTISSYEDLKGKTVGAKNGTASYTFLDENKAKYGYTLKPFDEASGMYDSLNSGSIDALMDDEAVLLYAIKQGRDFATPIPGEKSGEYGFAVKKGSNPELIEMFNNGLAALVESGQYDEIFNKYFNSTEETSSETASTVDETTILGLLKNNYGQLIAGLGNTIGLALLSFAIAIVIGVIFGMFAVSPIKALRVTASVFVDVVRGIPLMIVAAFIFWGIPNLLESLTGQQSPINDFVAGTIALSLNSGAYIAEIVRGGIQAVPTGQMEASRSLGISYGTTMRKIILPQAGRIMLPNFINQFVITLKDTTIISAIGLVELFQAGKIIIARNYQSFRMYAILAIIYLVVITLLTRLARKLEKGGK